MRNRNTPDRHFAERPSRQHTTPRGTTGKTFRETVRLALCLALLGQSLLPFAATSATAQTRAASKQSAGTTAAQSASANAPAETLRPVSVSVVNFKEVAAKEARAARTSRAGLVNTPSSVRLIHPPGTIDDSPAATATVGGEDAPAPAPSVQNDTTGDPLVPSPTPSTSYQGEFDEAVGGGPTGTFTIPPDTNGAVGLDKVFVNVNNNYVIQDKATGARLSVVSPAAFWASTGGSGFFDPQIQYDPYNNRWILAIASNAASATTSVEIALSQTSDPAGTYNMYRFIVGNATLNFADFPMLGYNQNFVAVAVNMFNTSNAFVEGRV
ncbi:MAG: hypothetical protein LC754_09025, partial [Acidobacteria bacterium]|nr:hypothetical protein [Acidobacteriota bacterium]